MDEFWKGAIVVRLVPTVLFLCVLVANVTPRIVSAVEPAVPRVFDLCGQHNGRRIYLESGRSGVITAKNVQILPLLVNVNIAKKCMEYCLTGELLL